MIFSRFKWNNTTVLELGSPVTALIHYRHHRFNLLTGFPEDFGIDEFSKKIAKVNLSHRVKNPTVYHFYYEYGLLDQGFGHLIQDDTPLVIELEYKKSRKVIPKKSRLTSLPLKTLERPSWGEYKETFGKVQEELMAGNCYQVNLTYPFDFTTEEVLDPRDIADYFFSCSGLGAYAHATYFGEGMFLSNSPECLFQYQDHEIYSMPIKGTVKCLPHEIKSKWKALKSDPKEEGELLMITDLLKNDLNFLSGHQAKVKKMRAPLIVPGLLHQYSLITAKLSSQVSLGATMKALFPGGSITGAPKRRVLDIISGLERFERGVYCGSTVLCYKAKKVASINIRTAAINTEERIWRYGAGGGCTLLSKAPQEYKEMESKVESFLTLLKSPGYFVRRQ